MAVWCCTCLTCLVCAWQVVARAPGCQPHQGCGAALVDVPHQEVSAYARGLLRDTGYVVYVVAATAGNHDTAQLMPVAASGQTTLARPPVFFSKYPMVGEVTTASAQFDIHVDEPATAYFVVFALPASDAPPSLAPHSVRAVALARAAGLDMGAPGLPVDFRHGVVDLARVMPVSVTGMLRTAALLIVWTVFSCGSGGSVKA